MPRCTGTIWSQGVPGWHGPKDVPGWYGPIDKAHSKIGTQCWTVQRKLVWDLFRGILHPTEWSLNHTELNYNWYWWGKILPNLSLRRILHPTKWSLDHTELGYNWYCWGKILPNLSQPTPLHSLLHSFTPWKWTTAEKPSGPPSNSWLPPMCWGRVEYLPVVFWCIYKRTDYVDSALACSRIFDFSL